MGSKSKRKYSDDTASSSSSPTPEDDSDSSPKSRRRRGKERRRSDGSSRREKERRREKRRRREKERARERRKSRRGDRKSKIKHYASESGSESDSGSATDSGTERVRIAPETVVRDLLNKFPSVGSDLRQLLQMVDDGQAVDINGISERALIKHLKKLFLSLKLKETGDKVFLLPSKRSPTLDVVGHLIQAPAERNEDKPPSSIAQDEECSYQADENNSSSPHPRDGSSAPRRVIGPEMPSAELLAAAAKLTEAQAELRDAELEEDTELFIGPPPPALVAEAESANEAERFEEVTRIMASETDSPYDVLGVNHNTLVDNIKKKYWKLSLLVHPDKCSHPQAHQAFIILNKAFKELQDPDKKKQLDEKIKAEEEKEAFKAELQAMREAAQWRRLQGISMEGDDELLAEIEVKAPRTRDEWMTTLPPERKPGVTQHSTKRFSKGTKEGRGDTSVWTDTPSERAQKAKMSYLEAYNEATALASTEEDKQRSSDADLVDKYNEEKRSKSLVQKHREEAAASIRSKKKRKAKQEEEKEEWLGKHPWRPWDREKDLAAGRQSVKFDSDSMAEGLASRFSSGNYQRNFL